MALIEISTVATDTIDVNNDYIPFVDVSETPDGTNKATFASIFGTDLTAIRGLTSAANKAPYATGAGTWAMMDLTAAGRALLDDGDAATQRTTLGLAIGTNVQAWDADLDYLAAKVIPETDAIAFRDALNSAIQLTLDNSDSGASSESVFSAQSDVSRIDMRSLSGSYTVTGDLAVGDGVLEASSRLFLAGGSAIVFGDGSYNELARIDSGSFDLLVPMNVPDDAYDATGWNGSTEVPTKNAIRDKIESMGGGGDVVGPASSVDNAIARFDGTTGKLIQDYTSGAPTISDTGKVKIPVDGSSADPPLWIGAFASANGFYAKSTGNAWEQGTAFVSKGVVGAAFGEGATYKELMLSTDWKLTFGAAAALSGTGSDVGIFRSASRVLGVDAGFAGGYSSLELGEVTAPSAPGSDRVRIYLEDNGSGKSRLMALFSSGAAQQLAIQP